MSFDIFIKLNVSLNDILYQTSAAFIVSCMTQKRLTVSVDNINQDYVPLLKNIKQYPSVNCKNGFYDSNVLSDDLCAYIPKSKKNMEMFGSFKNKNYSKDSKDLLIKLYNLESEKDYTNSMYIYIDNSYVNNKEKYIQTINSNRDGDLQIVIDSDNYDSIKEGLLELYKELSIVENNDYKKLCVMAKCGKGGYYRGETLGWWGSFLNTNDCINLDTIQLKILRNDEAIFVNEESKKSLDVSIVMAYFDNRKEQTLITLNRLEELYADKYNFEVIIVDDNSLEENRLDEIVKQFSYPVKYRYITKQEKGNRINPCTAYNIGFRLADGKYVMIQNPECYHMGDLIGYTLKHITSKNYLTFSCFSGNTVENSKEILNDFNLVYDYDFNVKNGKDVINWLNHPTYNQTNYHYCSVITRENLNDLGGFDETFSDGYCFDDNELVLSIQYILELNIKCVEPENGLVLHQFHKRNNSFDINNSDNDSERKILIKMKWDSNQQKFLDKKSLLEGMLSNNYLRSYGIHRGLFKGYDNIEKYNNIPKILYTYWDGSRISFLHYLTIYTLRKKHMDWHIILYIPQRRQLKKSWISFENKQEYSNIDYFDNLLNLDIDIRLVDISKIGIEDNISEIIKSDYFRLLALQYHGGIWYDMDMLFINKITIDSVFNTNNKLETYLIDNQIFPDVNNENYIINETDIKDNNYFQVIAKEHYCQYFLISDRNTEFVNYILSHVKSHLDINKYESIGTGMLNQILNHFFKDKKKVKSLLIDHNVVAPFKWYEMDILFNQNRANLKDLLKNSFAIHWFNGSNDSKTFINQYTHLEPIKDCTLKNVITDCSVFTENDLNFFKNLKKVSIVMSYLNRKDQLLCTLNTIVSSQYKNIEVIIVDDGSDEDQRLDDVQELYRDKIKVIKIINIDESKKTWLNPCIAYNIGIKEATGDIVIIQNPEIAHIGDCISYVVKNLRLNQWLTLNCYGLGNFSHNDKVYTFYKEEKVIDIYNYIKTLITLKSGPGGNSALGSGDVQGWLNNSRDFFTAYHYFGAIYRKDLMTKMNGGFDEEYKDGINLDDIDFVKRLIYNNIEFVSNDFSEYQPFTIHLYHTKSKSLCINPHEKHAINKKVFDRKCTEMNMNNEVNIKTGFKMPIPKIIN
jgi:glycosyltransferase involved in cell wall biosynthesis